jgi:hypothetical protein
MEFNSAFKGLNKQDFVNGEIMQLAEQNR